MTGMYDVAENGNSCDCRNPLSLAEGCTSKEGSSMHADGAYAREDALQGAAIILSAARDAVVTSENGGRPPKRPNNGVGAKKRDRGKDAAIESE